MKSRNTPARAGPPTVAPGGASAGELSAGRVALAIALLAALAAFLRLYRLELSPPGLNQDEALSAWMSWCLLQTGHDLSGQSWPIFYGHGVGDNPSTLFFYLLMPFQKLGGLGVWTTRLPVALAGVLCVPLLYDVGSRLFGRTTGLIAAALLAVNPWSVTIGRLGIGAGLCPFFALAALALLLRAPLPFRDGADAGGHPAWALFAGLVAGLSCYGFHPMKLYFPALFLLLALAAAPAWKRLRDSRQGLLALLLLALGFALTFGPLVYEHVVDPEVARRWEMTRLWRPGASLLEILRLVLGRYVIHFGPDFLFIQGDHYTLASPPRQGELEWALLPLLVIGLVTALRRARVSLSCAVLLAIVAAYPAGDLISDYDGAHAFRSAPGVPALLLLAAWGAASLLRALGRGARVWAVGGALAGLLLAQDAVCFTRYFGEWSRRPTIYHWFHTDYMEACRWLRPRLKDSDRVFWTVLESNMPFAITVVGLHYDARRWMTDEKDVRPVGGWDAYIRYGRMYFLYGQTCRPYVDALEANGRPDHAYFVVRPGELGLKDPVHVIRRPDGKEVMWICEGDL